MLLLRERGVRDTAVLRAMERVPRERFAPESCRAHARRDIALPLPCGQSMSPPTSVAAMLALLDLPGAGAAPRVLEVGTGSGYASALLLDLGAGAVLSLERYGTLVRAARARLAGTAASVEQADGLAPEAGRLGPFARILVNGLCPAPPLALAAALAPGGRLVAGLASPEGPRLTLIARAADGRLSEPALRDGPAAAGLPPLSPGRARAL